MPVSQTAVWSPEKWLPITAFRARRGVPTNRVLILSAGIPGAHWVTSMPLPTGSSLETTIAPNGKFIRPGLAGRARLLSHPLLLGCVLALLAGPPALAADVATVRPESLPVGLSIQALRPGVWLHVSWMTLANGRRFPANGLIVRDGDELILVDTAWGADNTTDLLALIESELGLPVSTAIVTHFHDDSMGGTGVLRDRGIAVVGGPLTRTLSGDGPLPDAIAGLDTVHAVALGNIEIFYPGPGHSEDNLVVWVPGAKVLFGSCAVRSPTFPGRGNTADADLENWPVAIARVRDRYRDVELVVPGHGAPGDAALLSHTIELFSE